MSTNIDYLIGGGSGGSSIPMGGNWKAEMSLRNSAWNLTSYGGKHAGSLGIGIQGQSSLDRFDTGEWFFTMSRGSSANSSSGRHLVARYYKGVVYQFNSYANIIGYGTHGFFPVGDETYYIEPKSTSSTNWTNIVYKPTYSIAFNKADGVGTLDRGAVLYEFTVAAHTSDGNASTSGVTGNDKFYYAYDHAAKETYFCDTSYHVYKLGPTSAILITDSTTTYDEWASWVETSGFVPYPTNQTSWASCTNSAGMDFTDVDNATFSILLGGVQYGNVSRHTAAYFTILEDGTGAYSRVPRSDSRFMTMNYTSNNPGGWYDGTQVMLQAGNEAAATHPLRLFGGTDAACSIHITAQVGKTGDRSYNPKLLGYSAIIAFSQQHSLFAGNLLIGEAYGTDQPGFHLFSMTRCQIRKRRPNYGRHSFIYFPEDPKPLPPRSVSSSEIPFTQLIPPAHCQ